MIMRNSESVLTDRGMHLNISLMRENGFVLRESQGILYYSCRAFESLAQVRHGFSTRCGGTSALGKCSLNLGNLALDRPGQVYENRQRFLSALHFENARLITLHQIHSNRVHIIEDVASRQEPLEGDALMTRLTGAALAVQTADCLPILIADPEKHAVAAVHSGWRGTLSRVLIKTILEMQRAFDSNPSQLLIAIGPGIRACCFEVGSEVADRFNEEYSGCTLAMPAPSRTGKYLLDLGKALDVQMDLAGIAHENRYDLNVCTRCNTKDFFSYRAEGRATGRMMAAIGIASSLTT
jgi:polyphenol oxidase